MKLIFGTSNEHKISEIQSLLPSNVTIESHLVYGLESELPENQDTITGNAIEKAQYIFEKTYKNCFAEDSGLVVRKLDGGPGVYSSRYAEINNSKLNNLDLLLEKLSQFPKEDWDAYFITVIALFYDKKLRLFEGKCHGRIVENYRGENGFGYDPIFLPKGSDMTFGEMSKERKSEISHRGIATRKLITFLKDVNS